MVFLAAYVYAINGEWREHDTMSHCFFFCFFVDIDEWDVPNSACATAPCAEGSYEAYFPYNLKQCGTNKVFLAAYVYAINGEWREHDTMSHCFLFFL